MKIKDIKDYLRPLDKFYKNGVNELSNQELLAILINSGTKEKNCIDLANDIFNSLNNESDYINIDTNSLLKIRGIGKRKAALIVSSIELVKRCQKFIDTNVIINDKEVVYNLLKPRIQNLKHEKIFVLFLNVKLKLIKLKEYDNFEISQISIPIRDIIKEAINNQASFIILSHNHPSGDTTPSKSDINSTIKLMEALDYMNIQLLDHIIVSPCGMYSLKENIDI